MKSHTVPQKLLEQFAYEDLLTHSLRLWQYKKGLVPSGKASPRTATRVQGHFSDPEDAEQEERLETRLAREFEEPVNKFLFQMGDPTFGLSEDGRRQLAAYTTLLFFRSEARRRASTHLQDVIRDAYEQFLGNEQQLLTVVANWNISRFFNGQLSQGLITKDDAVISARALMRAQLTEAGAQGSYVRSIERVMNELDDKLFSGDWRIIRTSPDRPFIISDAPVATWERLESGMMSYGLGFHRANVEAFLPISPITCLHILPNVERTREVATPTVREVNAAQAAFAWKACFANIESAEIDEIVQENFGKAELGVKSFTVWHRDYSTAIFNILMGQPDWLKRTQKP